MNLGYACINLSLGKKVTTNRTMVKRTFHIKGIRLCIGFGIAECCGFRKNYRLERRKWN
jgi:hypothetical protein